MTDLSDLLERVRNAAGPDRELDVIIAYITYDEIPNLSCTFREFVHIHDNFAEVAARAEAHHCIRTALPRYTASIDAALALVARVLPGWHGALTWLPDYGLNAASFACEIGPMDWSGNQPPDNIIGHGDSMPLAILAALLSALIAKEGAK
jgi:hypothetical protein